MSALYSSQQFDPHVVIQPMANGTCVKVFETHSRVFKNLTSKPRGNTQAVFVPSTFSGEPRDFYLGVVHAESNRAYQNYFYKMQVRANTPILTAVVRSSERPQAMCCMCPCSLLCRFIRLMPCARVVDLGKSTEAGSHCHLTLPLAL
jgi:hypothetical protein